MPGMIRCELCEMIRAPRGQRLCWWCSKSAKRSRRRLLALEVRRVQGMIADLETRSARIHLCGPVVNAEPPDLEPMRQRLQWLKEAWRECVWLDRYGPNAAEAMPTA